MGKRAELRAKKRELLKLFEQAKPIDPDLRYVEKDTVVNVYNNQKKHAIAIGTILNYIRKFSKSSYSEMKEALCDLPQLEMRPGMSSITLSKNLKLLEEMKVIEAIRDRQPARPPAYRFRIVQTATPFVLQMILATVDNLEKLPWQAQIEAMQNLGFTKEDIMIVNRSLTAFDSALH